MERLLLTAAFGEYLAQIAGGIPMSQGETVRLGALGVSRDGAAPLRGRGGRPRRRGTADATKSKLAALIADQPGVTTFGDTGLDETLDRDARRRCAASPRPRCCRTRTSGISATSYIPAEILAKLGELGVFGLTIPEEFGGLGLGKEAMCVVSEELSRGYIGVGSLGTRSEIAAELILGGGTDEQKQKYLPQDRLGRAAADGGVHRAQHRLRPRRR